MKRSVFLCSLITICTVFLPENARASIVPIAKTSDINIHGAVGDKVFNHSNSSDGLSDWSGDVVGYVDDHGSNYSTGSAGQGSAFEFDKGNLSKIALQMASDGAERGGAISGTSHFNLRFVVTESPVEFHIWGNVNSPSGNQATVRLVDLSDNNPLFEHMSKKTSDPQSDFEELGVLEPGQYELRAMNLLNDTSIQGVGTSIEATVQFESTVGSGPAAVPLPPALLPGLICLGGVVIRLRKRG